MSKTAEKIKYPQNRWIRIASNFLENVLLTDDFLPCIVGNIALSFS